MDRHARGDQVRRVAVPDVVEPTLPNAGLVAQPDERLGQPLGVQRPAELVAEDQITIAIGVAGQRAGE